MATESVNEMINMMPQLTSKMLTDPSEMMRETTKEWTRNVKRISDLTTKISEEMWTQGIKSIEETQKIHRNGMQTLQSWSNNWQTQSQQGLQRIVEMTNSPWK